MDDVLPVGGRDRGKGKGKEEMYCVGDNADDEDAIIVVEGDDGVLCLTKVFLIFDKIFPLTLLKLLDTERVILPKERKPKREVVRGEEDDIVYDGGNIPIVGGDNGIIC
jgi:hypothetical protein